jgi:hypothetical protein
VGDGRKSIIPLCHFSLIFHQNVKTKKLSNISIKICKLAFFYLFFFLSVAQTIFGYIHMQWLENDENISIPN